MTGAASKGRFACLIAGTGLTLAILWLAGFGFFLFHARHEAVGPTPRTDAIIVLTGGPGRINAGLDLLRGGLAGKLLISGVDSRVSVEKIISMWRKDSEPPCCITLGHEARNTAENAAEAKKWLEREKASSALLVTSGYHMPRARLEFSHALPEVKILPHPIMEESEAEDKKSLLFAFEEYNKTIFTWLRLTLDHG